MKWNFIAPADASEDAEYQLEGTGFSVQVCDYEDGISYAVVKVSENTFTDYGEHRTLSAAKTAAVAAFSAASHGEIK